MGFWSNLFGKPTESFQEQVDRKVREFNNKANDNVPLIEQFNAAFDKLDTNKFEHHSVMDICTENYESISLKEITLKRIPIKGMCRGKLHFKLHNNELNFSYKVETLSFSHAVPITDKTSIHSLKDAFVLLNELLPFIESELTTTEKLKQLGFYKEIEEPILTRVNGNFIIQNGNYGRSAYDDVKIYTKEWDEEHNFYIVNKIFDSSDINWFGHKATKNAVEYVYDVVKDFVHFSEWTQIDSAESYWIEEFANTRALQYMQRDKELSEYIEKIFTKHTEYNTMAVKHSYMSAAPIKNFGSYIAFCKMINLDPKYDDYLVENYLRNTGRYNHD